MQAMEEQMESLIKEGYRTEWVVKEVKKYSVEHPYKDIVQGLGYEDKEEVYNNKISKI